MTQIDLLGDAARSTCMKARVTTSTFGVRRSDPTAGKKAAADHHAVEGATRVIVNRLAGADEHHKAITQAQKAAGEALKRRSMPFGDEDGWRLLPTQQFEPLLRDIAVCKKQFDAAMARLSEDADAVLARAAQNIGDLQVDLPTKDELLESYSLKVDFEPIPEGKFNNGLPEPMAKRLSRAFDEHLAKAVEQAQRDTLERFVNPLSNFVERMIAFEQREQAIAQGKDVGRTGVFRDSTVDNIKELYGVLGSFNITGDERLIELGNRLASLAETKPDALRDNAAVRSAATERAQQTLAALQDWLS